MSRPDDEATGGVAPFGTLPFIVSVDGPDVPEEAGRTGDKGIFGRRGGDDAEGSGTTSVRDLPVAVLRENLQRAVDGLQQVIGSITVPEGGMTLREAQISFEVTASGGIAFVGTSAQVGAKGAITLTFGN
ncbi:hypothetical protein [Streptomyces sp. t39]|uniref:Pepco domain-containing protein n=1 Tax=Streptomyces sp. t39 TaxID=1828156 RepID=UPI00164FE234|nr:hypothetical protein [Streptomyces sp. t39]